MKYSECLHCEKMLDDCKIRKHKGDLCLMFVERKNTLLEEENKRKGSEINVFRYTKIM